MPTPTFNNGFTVAYLTICGTLLVATQDDLVKLALTWRGINGRMIDASIIAELAGKQIVLVQREMECRVIPTIPKNGMKMFFGKRPRTRCSVFSLSGQNRREGRRQYKIDAA